ncbi:MAG TPA: class I SAM-dependent methyltransferase [Dongiaceae bacterium]|jgi:SAM-dependent methyltransferase|nr:class I SAM-dependent methyltransferase [Dongiaceae bacterium]
MRKAPLGEFLARNPFPHGLTDGLFYREKMRAIHRIAPSTIGEHGRRARILEIGGGRSGLARMLYPDAEVTTLDVDFDLHGQGPAGAASIFVCGDARGLPFATGTFDAVTLFDVLEHIEDDGSAAREALRVTRPNGVLLVSTPNNDWHYPYYAFMKGLCPHETELMATWGHVRRGYSAQELARLFGTSPERSATFINPVTSLYHDIAFSRLPRRARKLLYAAAAPIVSIGYLAHLPGMRGSETAFAWRR